MIFSKQISTLKASVETLERDLATAHAGNEAIQAELTEAKANLANVSAEAAKIPGLEAKITEQETALAAEKARADKAAADLAAANAEADKKIEAEVVTRLAAAGVEPVKRDPSVKKDGEKPTMSLAEFNKLPHAKRNAFIREGGKISD